MLVAFSNALRRRSPTTDRMAVEIANAQSLPCISQRNGALNASWPISVIGV